MNLSNSILEELDKSNLFFISLQGVRTLLEREFLLKDLVLQTGDSAREELKRRLANPDLTDRNLAYPYSYMSLSDMTGLKDRAPNKNIRRHGWRMLSQNATRATSRKAYIFPAAVQIGLHYIDNDPIRLLRMSQAFIILGQLGNLVFQLKMGHDFELDVTVGLPDTATIPIAETENVGLPDASEIEVPLIIDTYCGFFRDVAAVNSDTPEFKVEVALSPDYFNITE
jgi:hypothetical protein